MRIKLYLIILLAAIAVRYLPLTNDLKLFIGYSEDALLNLTDLTAKHGYKSEEHTVITEDGYDLTIFRMVKAKNCHRKTKPRPVLVMHGFLENSGVFLDAGPNAGLGYLLSDACYDVWLGNIRGNNYGRKHLKLNPDKDADFWQFSVDEIAFYDVPASINYILKHTDADKINYIGFSQGCGVFFAMCSERPEYCEKTALMIALAPAVKLDNGKSFLLGLTFNSATILQNIFEFFGLYEITPKGGFIQELSQFICQYHTVISERYCATGGLLDNYNPSSVSPDTQRMIFTNFYVGTSLKTLLRYRQAISTGKFQKFDYGKTINLERYKSVHPPEYNLKAVTVPVFIVQGPNDALVNVKDTEWLANKLPNVIEMMVIPDSKWTHFDILYNKEFKNVIFPKIDEYLQKYS